MAEVKQWGIFTENIATILPQASSIESIFSSTSSTASTNISQIAYYLNTPTTVLFDTITRVPFDTLNVADTIGTFPSELVYDPSGTLTNISPVKRFLVTVNAQISFGSYATPVTGSFWIQKGEPGVNDIRYSWLQVPGGAPTSLLTFILSANIVLNPGEYVSVWVLQNTEGGADRDLNIENQATYVMFTTLSSQ